MGEWLQGTKLSQCPPTPSPKSEMASPVTNTGQAPTHQILHIHTATITQLLDNVASGVLPARAELDLCAWPKGLVPGCTTTLCVAARDQPWGEMGQGRHSPPTGPSPLATALGPAHPCRTAGCCGCLSWWGRGLRLGEMRSLCSKSCGTICKQK